MPIRHKPVPAEHFTDRVPMVGKPPKLTPAQIDEIAARIEHRRRNTNKALAMEYGVSETVISQIGGGYRPKRYA